MIIDDTWHCKDSQITEHFMDLSFDILIGR